mgnify:CR=1 FL=1
MGIEVFDEPDMAAAKHRAGLRRLCALHIKDALKYNFIDSAIALNLAFFVNASIFIESGKLLKINENLGTIAFLLSN